MTRDPVAGEDPESAIAEVLQRWLTDRGYAVHVVDADAVTVLREVVADLEQDPPVRFRGPWRAALSAVVEKFEGRQRVP